MFMFLETTGHVTKGTSLFNIWWVHFLFLSRVIASIRGAPQDYGVDEAKLRPFEKLLQNIEGKLMEGKIFEV